MSIRFLNLTNVCITGDLRLKLFQSKLNRLRKTVWAVFIFGGNND